MKYDTLVQRMNQAKTIVEYSPNGVAIITRRGIVPSNHVRAKRGAVIGFSKASCRRLRQLLWKVDYSNAVAVTLTRPHSLAAEFLALRSSEDTFDTLNRNSRRLEFVHSLIWRKEVTKNGEVHYHGILIPSSSFDPIEAAMLLVEEWITTMTSTSRRNVQAFGVEGIAADAEARFNEYLQSEVVKIQEKMRKAHFDKYRPNIQVFASNSHYVAYILNHQSKHKEYQAKTVGRAWGVWNRSGLPLIPVDIDDLSEAEKVKLGRVLRKVSRYRVNDERCLFGWYHTSGRRVQSHGRTVYFARRLNGNLAESVRRYVGFLRQA